MNSIGETLIKLFGGDDVYLGKTELTESPKPKKSRNFNILESIGNALNIVVRNVNPFQIISHRKYIREEEKRQIKIKKLKKMKIISDSFRSNTTSYGSQVRRPFDFDSKSDKHKEYIDKKKKKQISPNQDTTDYVKQKWNDNVDRPDLSQGRQYLQNIKSALVKKQAKPSQITETLFRDTFRKKNFSENNITRLWGEYNDWKRVYHKYGSTRLDDR